jgi:AcrR family transcriptional regulator
MAAAAPVLSARQARADDTRKRLFVAAAELFAEHGYHATSVDQIARRAGVAKGTFFVHFPTKDAVIRELVAKQMRAVARERERLIGEGASTLERLRATVLMLGHQAGLSRMISRAVLAAGLENSEIGGATDARFMGIYAEMVADARQASKEGLLVAHADPDVFARLLMASYLGAALTFSSSARDESLIDLLRPLVDTLIAQFGNKRKKGAR